MQKCCPVGLFIMGAVVISGCARPMSQVTSPINLGPNVNTDDPEGSPSISADGRTLYFDASSRPGGIGGWDIWVSEAKSPHGEFGKAAPLPPPVNSVYNDSGPCISKDGLTLYFASDRPGGAGDFDIWVTSRKSVKDPWGEPVNLGLTVNSPYYDNHPSLSADGLTLYFESRRILLLMGDIYMTRRAGVNDPWGAPQRLDVSTNGAEYSPEVSTDGLTLYYDSPQAGRDLWVARRASPADPWTKGVPLGQPFNTAYVDTDPSVSADGAWLYFVSNRPGGHGSFDIWRMSLKKPEKEN
jgi:Tol biopolymer transport system component